MGLQGEADRYAERAAAAITAAADLSATPTAARRSRFRATTQAPKNRSSKPGDRCVGVARRGQAEGKAEAAGGGGSHRAASGEMPIDLGRVQASAGGRVGWPAPSG